MSFPDVSGKKIKLADPATTAVTPNNNNSKLALTLAKSVTYGAADETAALTKKMVVKAVVRTRVGKSSEMWTTDKAKEVEATNLATKTDPMEMADG